MTEEEAKEIAAVVVRGLEEGLKPLLAHIAELQQRLVHLEAWVTAQMTHPRIFVIDGDWGSASPKSIREVCLSVARCFGPAIVERPLEPIRIERSKLTDPPRPRTLFERVAETGEIRIWLSARGNLGEQFAYQFAHELFHVLANIPGAEPSVVSSSEWFIESMGELSALFAMRAMARNWPPMDLRATVFHDYAEDILTDPQHQVPAGETFVEWLNRSLPELEQNQYLREKNAVVACQLLPLFEADVNTWCAVRYLNLWSSNDVPFAEYFSTWRSVTPAQHHAAIDRIEHVMSAR